MKKKFSDFITPIFVVTFVALLVYMTADAVAVTRVDEYFHEREQEYTVEVDDPIFTIVDTQSIGETDYTVFYINENNAMLVASENGDIVQLMDDEGKPMVWKNK